MYTEARPYGKICKVHGLQFISKADFENTDKLKCTVDPSCKMDCEIDADLHHIAMVVGCRYCKKAPIVDTYNTGGSDWKTFIYDNQPSHDGVIKSRAFCHVMCLRCYQRRCVIHQCKMTACVAMWLIIKFVDGEGVSEYLIPCTFCQAHGDRIPLIPDDNMWTFIQRSLNNQSTSGERIKREDCRIEMREY